MPSSATLLATRLGFVASYAWPPGLAEQLAREQSLPPAQAQAARESLRLYFRLCVRAGGEALFVPSDVVNRAWRLFAATRNYEDFCRDALGRFPQRLAAIAPMLELSAAQMRTWRLACEDEGLDPTAAERVPALFALDAALGVPGGQEHDARNYASRLVAARASLLAPARSASRTRSATDGGFSMPFFGSFSGDGGCGSGDGGCGGGE